MKGETNNLCSIGIDHGAPGGDMTGVLTVISNGMRFEIGCVDYFSVPMRRAGKSSLSLWLSVWRRKGYWRAVCGERAELSARLGARPRASRLRHVEKLERYAQRAMTGRG